MRGETYQGAGKSVGGDKKDDLSDMLPSSAVVKLLTEVLKSAR